MMASYVRAVGLLLQFFTVVPLHRTLPMDEKHMKAVLQLLPMLGLAKGILYAAAFWALIEWSPFSVLSVAFLVWLMPIIVTGGLHLDGWMDWADAHFSYRDRDRRLEIMSDPRTGAFGVLALMLLLFAKFIFIVEVVRSGVQWVPFLILVPFFAQGVTGWLLQTVPPVKQTGLAAFFSTGSSRALPVVYAVYFAAAAAFLGKEPLFWLMTGAISLYTIVVKTGIQRIYGGITGDLLGAAQEGAEAYLWMILWLSASIATG